MYMLGIHGGQKRVSDLMDLELQIIVSHHVDVETRIQVLCKSS